MSSQWFPSSLELPAGMLEILYLAAAEAVRERRARRRWENRARRGATLRPGDDTPLWNAVRLLARAQIRRYGEKALLARHLGLPRQRVHEFLKSGAAMPDGERALQLLAWIAGRRRQAGGRAGRQDRRTAG